jgi:hypothetical protein
MSTPIFVSLSIAGEGFLLYCLYHFKQELNKASACECPDRRTGSVRSRPLPSDLHVRLAGVRNSQVTGRKRAA